MFQNRSAPRAWASIVFRCSSEPPPPPPSLIFAILQMLQEPHADNPLEADIARQLAEDKEAFNQTAKKWTLDFASP